MPSPFPGMDPYLESPAHWPDFHGRFINALSEAISDTLPAEYFARIQEDVLLLQPEPPSFKVQPDVLVARDGPSRSRTGEGGGVATLEPTTLSNVLDLDTHTEHFVEIVRLPDAEVVTVIEVLSPTNKLGGGRGIYANKRYRILQGFEVNLVEIDLLRAGRPFEMVGVVPAAHYHAYVSRADRVPDCDVYSWTVRAKLPTIPIPLRAGTPDAAANLALAFATAYDRGRYGRIVKYGGAPPAPPFSDVDLAWVTALAGHS